MPFDFYNDFRVELKKSHREYRISTYQASGIKQRAGICSGSALQWATDVLSEIAGNNKTVGFSIPDKRRFYDISTINQGAMEFIYNSDKLNAVKNVVDVLNRQGKFLKKKNNYNIDYSAIDGLGAEKKVNLMLGSDKSYKNTALIISAFMQKHCDKEHQYSHAIAILNYEGELFLFDASRGVCKLPANGTVSCNTLLRSVAEFFGIDKNIVKYYRLNPFNYHIFMKLKTSQKTNKHIVTREAFQSSQA